jgi:hypothetical protein
MPNDNNAKQHEVGGGTSGKPEPMVSSFCKSGRKAPGTRLGGLPDWREGSTKSGRIAGRHGYTLRDGR